MNYFFIEQLRELNIAVEAECKPNTSLQVVKIFSSNACILVLVRIHESKLYICLALDFLIKATQFIEYAQNVS